MKKAIAGLIAASLFSFPIAVSASEKQLILIAEENGSKFYIDPSTIKRQPPMVWLWSYVVPSPKFTDAGAFDNFMSVDCGAELIRVYEVITYDRNGDVMNTRSVSTDELALSARTYGAKGKALIATVCRP